MKTRSILLVVFCLILAVITAQAEEKTLSYQGRLTDNAGDPVADGVQTFDFRIYTAAVGGGLLWSETGVAVSTVDGLFSTQIGTINSIPQTVFSNNDSLWLEVEVNSETMSPRSYLSSSPFARLSQGIKSYSTFLSINTIETDPDFPAIVTYGDDGQEQVRLWGESWGELLLRDEEINNYQDAALTSNGAGSGGSLYLRDNNFTQIALEAGAAGNSSVVVPTDAIDADEMLNEPGLAASIPTNFFDLDAGIGDYVVDSIELDAPTNGYVVVTTTGYINFEHVNGVYSTVCTNVEKDTIFSFTEGMSISRINFNAPSGVWVFPFHTSRAFSVNAGTNKFYFNAYYLDGTTTANNIARSSFIVQFFPTLYGTLTKSADGNNGLENISIDPAVEGGGQKVTTITVAEHKVQLEAQRKEIEAQFDARLQELEKRLDKMSQKETKSDN